VTVAREEPKACPHCNASKLVQDPDVLDTWFSSALWPFSTLGWPDQTKDLEVFYPTSLMITGFDILFFWVARMMMMGLECMGDVPFRAVYIHSLVRDAEKQKMSKTRGNVIDPLAVTEKYGTDAVRFTLAVMAAPGTDIALSEDRMEGYRAFANKIWNAARFLALAHEKSGAPPWVPPVNGDSGPVAGQGGKTALEDRWIFSRLSRLAEEMATAWESFRFHDAAHSIYHFFWHEFCDWYLELKKLALEQEQESPLENFENLYRALDRALRLLHPMMPFITEELWQRLGDRGTSIALAPFPAHDPKLVDEAAEKEMVLLQEIIVNIRNMRAEMRVDARRKIPVELYAAGNDVARLCARCRPAIERLANLSALRLDSKPLSAEGGAVRSLPEFAIKIALKDAVDVEAERGRLLKEEQKLVRELEALDAQLRNDQFLSKAPEKVVESLRQRKSQLAVQHLKVTETLQKLS
jgi:valyl-tRNA synthetase